MTGLVKPHGGAGLDRPRQGSVRGDGEAIAGPDPPRVLVFQDPTLYPWRNVWSNVALGLEARGQPRIGRAMFDLLPLSHGA
jgi:NitT/TauT family transport system ATP-binding protein